MLFRSPKLPTLDPWVLRVKPPADRLVFVRNPYYYRVDAKGQQLPYIDRVIFTVAATNLVPAKAGLGEADLQGVLLARRQLVDAALGATQARVDALKARYRLLVDAHLIWGLQDD